jgi:hypothetical protein
VIIIKDNKEQGFINTSGYFIIPDSKFDEWLFRRVTQKSNWLLKWIYERKIIKCVKKLGE